VITLTQLVSQKGSEFIEIYLNLSKRWDYIGQSVANGKQRSFQWHWSSH